MSLLFDTSPQEDAPKRKGRRKTASPAVEEPSVSLPVTCHFRPIIGRVDEGVACIDSRCRAECHDITDTRPEKKGIHWLLECCFCGTGQWIPAIDGRLDEPAPPVSDAAGEFVFPEGQRGAGCTVAEYYGKSPDYVRWASNNEPNEEIRKACQTYLASIAVPG
jgi:hypothetical protein